MDANGIERREVVSASRKLGKADAAKLARDASRVVVAKGKKVEEFKPGGKAPASLVEKMLGPTGNLRAPCLRAGKTVVVGFEEGAFRDVLC